MNYFAWVFFEILGPLGRLYASIIKHYLVVSRDDHLVPEFEAIEVLKELEEVFITAISGEVSGVDEDVSAHLCDLVELAVAPVGVRYHNNIQLFTRQLLHVYNLNVGSNKYKGYLLYSETIPPFAYFHLPTSYNRNTKGWIVDQVNNWTTLCSPFSPFYQ